MTRVYGSDMSLNRWYRKALPLVRRLDPRYPKTGDE